MSATYPYTRLFPTSRYTTIIAGPYLQVISTASGKLLWSLDHNDFEADVDNPGAALKESGQEEASAVVLANFPARKHAHGSVCCAASEGRYLLTVGEDKILCLWELLLESFNESGVLNVRLLNARELPKKPTALGFTKDGHSILVSDKFGDVFSYKIDPEPVSLPVTKQKQNHRRDDLSSHENPSNGTLILGHASPLNAFLLTPDNKYIITADRDEHIRVSLFPEGYNIEMFCLGHKKFVSAIHLPATNPDILVSGGGDEGLKAWNWLSGVHKWDVHVWSTVEPFIVVKTRLGDTNEKAEPLKRMTRRGRRQKGKAKNKEIGIGNDVADNIDEPGEKTTAQEREGADASAEIIEKQEKKTQKVLVVQKIASMLSEGTLYIVFSAVGATALFCFQYPTDGAPASNNIQSLDFSAPIIDFTLWDEEIWVSLDNGWDGGAINPDRKLIRVAIILHSEFRETNSKHRSLLDALNGPYSKTGSLAEIKKLDLYRDLLAMPKYEAEDDNELKFHGVEKALSKKELGRLKTKQKKMQMVENALLPDLLDKYQDSGEDDAKKEEPDGKRMKARSQSDKEG